MWKSNAALVIVVGVVFCLFAFVGFSAAVQRAVSPNPDAMLELAGRAEGVALVRSLGSRSYWSADGTTIRTEYALASEVALHGVVPHQFVVVGDGGEVGEVGLMVSHAPRFETGRQYVVTLDHLAVAPEVAGGADGVREIETNEASSRRLLSDLHSLLAARQHEEAR